jgi:cysteine desulfurase/selenocysteine lyase
MVAEGQVQPGRVEYNALPWKYAAGTPNTLGTIVSAEAMRVLLDLALSPRHATYFRTLKPVEQPDVKEAMGRVCAWNQSLTARALDRLSTIRDIAIYGPRDAAGRTSLVAFNVAGQDPMELARALNEAGVESRAGCHCASLAHRALDLEPAGSCRLSFYLYNTLDEVDYAADVLAAIVADRGKRRMRGDRLRAPAHTPVRSVRGQLRGRA